MANSLLGQEQRIVDQRIDATISGEIDYINKYGNEYWQSGTKESSPFGLGLFSGAAQSLGASGRGKRAWHNLKDINFKMQGGYSEEELWNKFNDQLISTFPDNDEFRLSVDFLDREENYGGGEAEREPYRFGGLSKAALKKLKSLLGKKEAKETDSLKGYDKLTEKQQNEYLSALEESELGIPELQAADAEAAQALIAFRKKNGDKLRQYFAEQEKAFFEYASGDTSYMADEMSSPYAIGKKDIANIIKQYKKGFDVIEYDNAYGKEFTVDARYFDDRIDDIMGVSERNKAIRKAEKDFGKPDDDLPFSKGGRVAKAHGGSLLNDDREQYQIGGLSSKLAKSLLKLFGKDKEVKQLTKAIADQKKYIKNKGYEKDLKELDKADAAGELMPSEYQNLKAEYSPVFQKQILEDLKLAQARRLRDLNADVEVGKAEKVAEDAYYERIEGPAEGPKRTKKAETFKASDYFDVGIDDPVELEKFNKWHRANEEAIGDYYYESGAYKEMGVGDESDWIKRLWEEKFDPAEVLGKKRTTKAHGGSLLNDDRERYNEGTQDTRKNPDLYKPTDEEYEADRERSKKWRYDANQVIMEEQYDPRSSINNNIERIIDAAKYDSKYAGKSPYGKMDTLSNLKLYTVEDGEDRPEGYKIMKNINLHAPSHSPEYVLSRYGFGSDYFKDTDKEMYDYDVKQHLLDFLKNKKERTTKAHGGSLLNDDRERYQIGGFSKAAFRKLKSLFGKKEGELTKRAKQHDPGELFEGWEPLTDKEHQQLLKRYEELKPIMAHKVTEKNANLEKILSSTAGQKFEVLVQYKNHYDLTGAAPSINRIGPDDFKWLLKKEAGEKIRTKKAEGGVEDQMNALALPIAPDRVEETHTMPDGTVMPGATHEEYEEQQLPDEEMEADYVDFVVSSTLKEEDQNYLESALLEDAKLSEIFDQVVESASEFSGSGPIEGPGSEVSDSIPARLSDGEFVFTAKATEEIGADNLQQMMEAAEAGADGRQGVVHGGMIDEEDGAIPLPTQGSKAALGRVPNVVKQSRQVEEEMLKSSPRRYYVPVSG